MKTNLSSYDITPYEQAELEDIMENGVDYKFSPLFTKGDSYKTLFKDPDEIPEPATGWFLRIIHGSSEETKPRSKKAKVLTTEQERLIFYQYNWTKYKIAQQQMAKRPDISVMIHFLREKNRIRQKIVAYNLALVLNLVKKSAAKNLSFEELISTGNMILVHCLDKFDTGQGTKFSTYLTLSIPRAFAKESKKMSKYNERFPVNIDPLIMNTSSGHSNEWLADPKTEESGEADENVVLMRRVIEENLAELTEVEMKIIRARYPLDENNDYKRPTLQALGEAMECSKSNLNRLEKIAVRKLKDKMVELIGPEPEL
tara:strand:- start:2011 stop:2952 length:942 start_codon:yes stop_codon:yes gene_type:complete